MGAVRTSSQKPYVHQAGNHRHRQDVINEFVVQREKYDNLFDNIYKKATPKNNIFYIRIRFILPVLRMINYIHMVTIRIIYRKILLITKKMRNIIINTVLIQYGMAFLKNHAMRLYKKKFLKQRIN